jgi:hypothetical protein
MTSIHQTTNLVFPNFFHKFFSVLAVEKEKEKLLVPNKFFLSFGPMENLFSFLSAQTEKNLWKKKGKTRLVV